ncbi:sodium:solute symporter family transporter [Halonotius roseus]|uniref:Sodium:proline symporter n=1 Tax=Halonotius roseus TaxID=2511997 RepID=A0A544QKP9_9EURY|nr:sodium:proline symporter [Halonotius roseus]TQQ78940.1 sodium:proline symporter [Halonotius roseus]
MVSTTLGLGLTIATLAVFTVAGLLYSRGRVGSVEDLLTARNSTGTGMTTATLIASTMGAWILFSPAEAGAAFGGITAVFGYAVGSAIPLLLFIPVGKRIRELMPSGHSLTEFVLVRFGPAMYGFVLIVSVFYMFVFLAAEMTGIAGALELIAGVPPWQTATVVGGFVLLYTAYGGLVASIFTDTVQTLVILPLLAVGFAAAVVSLGGTGELYRTAMATDPTLLDPGFRPGLEFGLYVVFAILGANMLNQGIWQRVHAADGAATLGRAFGIAALTVIPMVLLSGLFGVAAAGLGLTTPETNSVAFFLVVTEALPDVIAFVVVMLVVLLVMSSADTMFNAISSLVTVDLARIVDIDDDRSLRLTGRAVTVLVAVGAVVIGAQQYSVLALFLTADLFAAAVFVPLIWGLYARSLTEGGALAASLAGLAVGVAYMPTLRGLVATLPGVGGLLPEPAFLPAFLGATLVSAAVTAAATAAGDAAFSFGSLATEIRSFEEPAEPPADESPTTTSEVSD